MGSVIGDWFVLYDYVFVHKTAKVHPSVSFDDGITHKMQPDGTYKEWRPHTGYVIICKGAEIRAGSVINRATFDATIIGEGTIVNNLVNVGHNTVIGPYCMLFSGVTVGGSCRVSHHTWLSQGVCVRQHITIAPWTCVGQGGNVLKSLERPGIYYGNPVRWIREWTPYTDPHESIN